ncbi:hypothetical protein N665_2151s0005 [Sinapis alba]|nr:hypothetical protein N665_2151s0005 [Sinapis alba]
MSVEATHMNLLASQFITNGEYVKSKPNVNNDITVGFPTTFVEQQLPYGRFNEPSFNKSESDVTYNFNQSSISKRQRDHTFDSNALMPPQKRTFDPPQTSSIDAQIHQHQSEIDRFVAQQTETLRLELEARQQTQTRMLASAVQSAIIKTLKAKDEEIIRMGKLNWVLQERVKSLYVENQIWRDLAQTNEATANTLRSNLEQVLAQVDDIPATVNGGDGFRHSVEEDAVSSCGSCEGDDVTGGCRRCGERRASVLVLPCRHLCLCTVCGSALLQECPVCDTVMNASVHVNMSDA